MILYLIAALALGTVIGFVFAIMILRFFDKRSKRKRCSHDQVTKSYLEILRH